jgi:outer membrane protein assembly factor BamB
MFRGDQARDGHTDGAILTVDDARHLKLMWTASLNGPVYGSPIVAQTQNGRPTVAASSDGGEIAAFDLNSGAPVWRRTGLGKFSGSPAVEGGWLVAATLTGHVYAFDFGSGDTLWDWAAPGVQPAIWSSPVIFGQLVLVGIGSQYGDSPLEAGRVVALDFTTGRQKWIFCVEASCAPGGGVWSSVAVDSAGRGFVGVGNPDDGVIAFDAATGSRLWARSFHNDAGNDLDVGATPIIATVGGKEAIADGSNGGLFDLLDATNGTVIWSRFLVHGSAVHGLIASPAYDGTSFYVPSASPPTGMFALDPRTGTTQWRRDTSLPIYSAPAVGSQVVIFGTGDVFGDRHKGSVLALSTTGGDVLWSYDAQASVLSAPAIWGVEVVVGDTLGRLRKFSPG